MTTLTEILNEMGLKPFTEIMILENKKGKTIKKVGYDYQKQLNSILCESLYQLVEENGVQIRPLLAKELEENFGYKKVKLYAIECLLWKKGIKTTFVKTVIEKYFPNVKDVFYTGKSERAWSFYYIAEEDLFSFVKSHTMCYNLKGRDVVRTNFNPNKQTAQKFKSSVN